MHLHKVFRVFSILLANWEELTIFCLLVVIFSNITHYDACDIFLMPSTEPPRKPMDECHPKMPITLEARLRVNSLDKIPKEVTQEEILPQRGPFRIPRILHQTWKTRDIPIIFHSWIKSFFDNNKNWTYRFWSDESARELVRTKYPMFLPFYDHYSHGIFRADAIRYILLYEYGGVYADIDVRSLRSLDPFLRKYACFLGQEPHEHPILESRFDGLACNALMACRKEHPFIQILIQSLPSFFHFPTCLAATGPHFLTLQYRNYLAANQFLDSAVDDGVYLAPPEYFFPSLDSDKFDFFRMTCYRPEYLPNITRWACEALVKWGYERKPYAFSYTQHMWYHTNLHEIDIDTMETADILMLAPDGVV
ncbi:hypothetical protein ACJMK2_005471 [Sinanodonta woodiana]|uniref:Uncharacterized protein n=1 Tax=Sinanodonta woodiana TaxID=1069815 RepID=A0ABD3VQ54_SINWO